jgi:hypothetical protein
MRIFLFILFSLMASGLFAQQKTKVEEDILHARKIWALGQGSAKKEFSSIVYVITSSSTHQEVPSAKAVWDLLQTFSAPGDDWGAQSVVHSTELAGNGTTASPLQLAQQSASVGQTLKWNGSIWAPAADNNTTYTAGAGLQLTGTVFSADDTSPTNELQTLSLSGDTLYLSDGGFVPFPTGSVGVYTAGPLTGSGTIFFPVDLLNNSIGDTYIIQGSIDSTEVTNLGLSTYDLSQMGADSAQVLTWNGTNWVPADPPAGGSGGHTIRDNGSDETTRTGLNFINSNTATWVISDDAGGDETEVRVSVDTSYLTTIYDVKNFIGDSVKTVVEGYGIDVVTTNQTYVVTLDTSGLVTTNDYKEPNQQILVGTGGGIDSYSPLKYNSSNRRITHIIEPTNGASVVGYRMVDTLLDNTTDPDINYMRFVLNDPNDLLGYTGLKDSISILYSTDNFQWNITTGQAGLAVRNDIGNTISLRSTDVSGSFARVDVYGTGSYLEYRPATGATLIKTNTEQDLSGVETTTRPNHTSNSVPGVEVIYGALSSTSDSSSLILKQTFAPLEQATTNRDEFGTVLGLFKAGASGVYGKPTVKAYRHGWAVRQNRRNSSVDRVFDWIKVKFVDNDTSSNMIEFYNGKYPFPNATPSSGTQIIQWANGVPSFVNIPTGTITGSGVSGRTTYWTGTSSIGSSASWIFDGTATQSMGSTPTTNGVVINGVSTTAGMAMYGGSNSNPHLSHTIGSTSASKITSATYEPSNPVPRFSTTVFGSAYSSTRVRDFIYHQSPTAGSFVFGSTANTLWRHRISQHALILNEQYSAHADSIHLVVRGSTSQVANNVEVRASTDTLLAAITAAGRGIFKDLKINDGTASTGYVWTATDNVGNGQWQVGATGTTTGTGLANRMALWNSGTDIGYGRYYVDTTNVRYGVNITPSYRVHVDGVSGGSAFAVSSLPASGSAYRVVSSTITGSANMFLGSLNATTGAFFRGTNGDTSSTADMAIVLVTANSGGDPYIRFSIAEVADYHIGVNAVTGDYTIGMGSRPSLAASQSALVINNSGFLDSLNVGSDALGDIYFRDSAGLFQRLPIGTEDQVLTVQASLYPGWADATGGDPNAFVQNGNSFGEDAYLGTNDTYNFYLETDGTPRILVDTFGKVTSTVTTASTAAATEAWTLVHNSSGTAADDFGADISIRLESTTTDAQEAVRLSSTWFDADNASMDSRFAIYLREAGTMKQQFLFESDGRMYLDDATGTGVQISSTAFTPQQTYTFGGSGAAINVSSLSTVQVTSSAASPDAAKISVTDWQGGIKMTGSDATDDLADPLVRIERNMHQNSGGGALEFGFLSAGGSITQSAGSDGISYGVWVNPTLTGVVDFRNLWLSTNNANSWGVYQEGDDVKNLFAGSLVDSTMSAGSPGDVPISTATGWYWGAAGGGDDWGSQVVARDSSLKGDGTTGYVLGIKGYGTASNGMVPVKSAGGFTWTTPVTTNLYIADGTLTGDRAITGAGFDLYGTGVDYFGMFSADIELDVTDDFLVNSDDRIDLLAAGANGIYMEASGGHVGIHSLGGDARTFSMSASNYLITDLHTTTKRGLRYAAFYSDIKSNAQSIPDMQTVRSTIADSVATYTEGLYIDIAGTGEIRVISVDTTNLATLYDLSQFADQTTVGAFQSSSDAAGLSESAHAIRLHAASSTTPGGVSTGNQTFGGAKTIELSSASRPDILTLLNPNTGEGNGSSLNLEGGTGNVKLTGINGDNASSDFMLRGDISSLIKLDTFMYIDGDSLLMTLMPNLNGTVNVGGETGASLLDVHGETQTTTFQMTNGASSGYIGTSDGSGNMTWTAPLVYYNYYIESSTGTSFDLDAGGGIIKDKDGTNATTTIPTNTANFRVYLNGQRLMETGSSTTRDYSVNTTTNVLTFSVALTSDDVILIEVYR